MWDQSKYALDFFDQNSIPFWNMVSADELVSNDNWCFVGETHIVLYLKEGGTAAIDLSNGDDNDPYIVQWFDPRNGGPLLFGSNIILQAAEAQPLGVAPSNSSLDWVVLLTKCGDCPTDSDSDSGFVISTAVIAPLFLIAVVTTVLYWRKSKTIQTHSNDSSTATSCNRQMDATSMSNVGEESGGTSTHAVQILPVTNQADFCPLEFKDQIRGHRCDTQTMVPAAAAVAVDHPVFLESTSQKSVLEARVAQLEALLLEKNNTIPKDQAESSLDQTESTDDAKPAAPQLNVSTEKRSLPTESFVDGEKVPL